MSQITTEYILLLLLPHFCIYFFTSHSVVFVDGGVKMFLASGHRVP